MTQGHPAPVLSEVFNVNNAKEATNLKTRFKKLLSMLLALTMLLSLSSVNVFAAEAEALPTTLPAPDGIILYDDGSSNTNLVAKISNPAGILDVYDKGYTNRVYDDEAYKYVSDYGDAYLYDAVVQLDWKIDDGDWKYTSDWDTNYSAAGSYCYDYFSNYRVDECGLGYACLLYTSPSPRD